MKQVQSANPYLKLINKERMIQTFVRSAQIWAPSGHEKEMAEQVVKDFQQMNDPAIQITVDDTAARTSSDTGNVIIDIPASPDAPPDSKAIGLFFHLDRVPVRAKGVDANEPVQIEITPEGVIRSKGSRTNIGADNRCGYTDVKEAVHSILENHIPHGKMRIVGFVKEETDMAGAQEIDLKYLRDLNYGFDFDGDKINEVVRSCPFIYEWKAEIKGKSAHSAANPEAGRNAVEAAVDAVKRIGKWGKIGRGKTLNVAYIRGGLVNQEGQPVLNVVPDQAEVAGEFRVRDIKDAEPLKQKVENAFQKAASKHGVELKYSVKEFPGYNIPRRSSIVSFAQRAIRKAGLSPAATLEMGGTDGNWINKRGLTTVAIGDGSSDVHTEHEYTTVDDLANATAVVMAIIAESANPPIHHTTRGKR